MRVHRSSAAEDGGNSNRGKTAVHNVGNATQAAREGTKGCCRTSEGECNSFSTGAMLCHSACWLKGRDTLRRYRGRAEVILERWRDSIRFALGIGSQVYTRDVT